MAPALLTPLLAALAAGVSASLLQRRLRPRLAAQVLSVIAVGSALAVVWGAAALAVGFVVQLPWFTAWAGWCGKLYRSGDRVPPASGVLGLVVVVTAVGRAGLVGYRHRRGLGLPTEPGPLEILSSDEPIAFAMPGRPGTIVVSTGMLDRLDADEQRVLFAHEQSHLDHRHDRYLLMAEMAAAAIPLLRPVAAQVRFSTERWADEDAVMVVGDRKLVARAVAKAALATAAFRPRPLALARLGVLARVEALHHPPGGGLIIPVLCAALGAGAVAANLAGSTVQLHHLVTFAARVCNLS